MPAHPEHSYDRRHALFIVLLHLPGFLYGAEATSLNKYLLDKLTVC